ncbi:hypothetical protein R1sor_004461 [Riccia sorocarpa]|uniref:Uncharacterized protein n=1 Tax=Riccia sorocarpa TaxID=122646 RepID=A0ABD3HGS7_9MARC
MTPPLLQSKLDKRHPIIELFIPTELSRRFNVNFCLGPSSLLTPVRNAVRGLGSLPSLSRSFASRRDLSSVEEKVGEVVAEGARGEGQGGDEGLTASVSGREAPAKKPRRRKIKAQEGIREAATEPEITSRNVATAELGVELTTRVESSSNKVIRTGLALDEAIIVDNHLQIENVVSVSSKPVTKRKRDKETLCAEEPGSQRGHTSPNLGKDAIQEIGALENTPALGIRASSGARCSDSESDKPLIRKGDAGIDVINSSRVEVLTSEQERRLSSFTSVVDKLLHDEKVQTSSNASGTGTASRVLSGQDKHLRPGAGLTSGSSISAVDPSVKPDYTDPHKVYKLLQSSRAGRPFQGNEKARLNSIFYRFSVSG